MEKKCYYDETEPIPCLGANCSLMPDGGKNDCKYWKYSISDRYAELRALCDRLSENLTRVFDEINQHDLHEGTFLSVKNILSEYNQWSENNE